jgi:hypothetical protein
LAHLHAGLDGIDWEHAEDAGKRGDRRS